MNTLLNIVTMFWGIAFWELGKYITKKIIGEK